MSTGLVVTVREELGGFLLSVADVSVWPGGRMATMFWVPLMYLNV